MANAVPPTSESSGRPPLWTLKATQLLGAAAFACLGKYIPVYYTDVGVSRQMLGILGLVGMLTNFTGQLFWSAVIKQLGEYKRVLVGTQFVGTILLLCYMLDAVKNSIGLIFLVTIVNTFFMSTGGSIIDAMCMSVLDEYKVAAQNPHRTPRTARAAEENYGDLRLYSAVGWGGMSLLTGWLIDAFGTNMMFLGFAVIQALNIGICVIFMPSPKPVREEEVVVAVVEEAPSNLCRASVVWFFINLIIYGVGMCLIENYLFVYLIQEFDGTPSLLLGASTAVMCLFEIPVFKYLGAYLENQPADSETGITMVLFGCQVIVALRCFLYLMIPKQHVWLVLFVEPLHGICFAGMWGATMEYAKRLAGISNVAQMTALVNGIYYQISMGIGGLVWGQLVSNAPVGIGFANSFKVDIVATIVWSIVWQIGLVVIAKTSRSARQVAAPDAREGLNS